MNGPACPAQPELTSDWPAQPCCALARRVPCNCSTVNVHNGIARADASPGVADAFAAALSQLDDDRLRDVIIDLRGTPGGRLDVGARMLSELLPADAPAFQQIDRGGTHDLRASSAGLPTVQITVVVRIDSDSSSMSELFAAAVREYQVGMLIGQTTAGNVAGGQLFPLADGSAMDVTTSELRSAYGAVLDGRGVDPDEWVVGTRATDPNGDDPAVRAALRYLSH